MEEQLDLSDYAVDMEGEKFKLADDTAERLENLEIHPATSAPDAPHTISQLSKIAAHLRRLGHISLWDTFYRPGNGINCVRLASRITDLKKLGVLFVEKNGKAPMMKLENGKNVARYELRYFDPMGVRARREHGA